MKKIIYLDYASTTPVDPRVLKTMLPYFTEKFGNTMSLHSFGREASQALTEARKTLASIINADPEEIIFTGSATESNNLAVKGLAAFYGKEKNEIIISPTEHDCILESARSLSSQGFKIHYLPVDRNGLIDLKKLEQLINSKTLLVSVIHGNNEVGTLQDLSAIGKICREKQVFFHTDAAQSFVREKIDVKKMQIDLLTGSSQKIYGPKGAALLYVRKGVVLKPVLHGGGHENGLRSSTSNLPAIVGFAKAAQIMQKNRVEENKRIARLRDLLVKEVLEKIPRTKLNGHPTQRLANNANISFAGVEGESLLLELDFNGIAVSTGSACSSRTLEPSHVLMALGLQPEQAHGSIRFSLGRWTTKSEIKKTVKVLEKVVKKIRSFSPFGN